MTPRHLLIAIASAITLTISAGMGSAHADGGPFGVGLTIGSPTGFNAKLYLNRSNAIDFGFGAALVGERGVTLHADYLWHPFVLTEQATFSMPVYLGIGGRILGHDHQNGTPDDTHAGVRFPIGFLFDFKNVPMDAFLEAALIIDVIEDEPEGEKQLVDLNAALGVRYYF